MKSTYIFVTFCIMLRQRGTGDARHKQRWMQAGSGPEILPKTAGEEAINQRIAPNVLHVWSAAIPEYFRSAYPKLEMFVYFWKYISMHSARIRLRTWRHLGKRLRRHDEWQTVTGISNTRPNLPFGWRSNSRIF